MKLCKFQLALGIVMCASGAGVAVRVIIGLMTKEYASFLTIAVILLVMCLLIIAIGVRFLILVRKPRPNSTKRVPSPDYRNDCSHVILRVFLPLLFFCAKHVIHNAIRYCF